MSLNLATPALTSAAVIGNDSAQTLGTYLAVNKTNSRFLTGLPIVAAFFLTMASGTLNDDLAFGRELTREDGTTLDEIRAEGNDLGDLAGISTLFGLTAMGIPVSTTVFTAALKGDAGAVSDVLAKSAYGLAAGGALGSAAWGVPAWARRRREEDESEPESKPKTAEVPEATSPEVSLKDCFTGALQRGKDKITTFPANSFDWIKSRPVAVKAALSDRYNIVANTPKATRNLLARAQENIKEIGYEFMARQSLSDKFSYAVHITTNTVPSLLAAQTATTLWVFNNWLEHDFVNVLAFTPPGYEAFAVGASAASLCALFAVRGGKIQEFTDDLFFSDQEDKAKSIDIAAAQKAALREAIKFDLAYVALLMAFKGDLGIELLEPLSALPTSTTWLYAGLHMGRAMAREGVDAVWDISKNAGKLAIGAGTAIGVTQAINALG